MKRIGGLLFFLGIGSAVLHFFDMELILLAWIESWGSTTAWIIRGVLTVVGAALWLVGNKNET